MYYVRMCSVYEVELKVVRLSKGFCRCCTIYVGISSKLNIFIAYNPLNKFEKKNFALNETNKSI